MPKIKTFSSESDFATPGGIPSPRRATAEDFGGGAFNSGAEAGKALTELGDFLEKKAKWDDNILREKTVAQGLGQWSDWLLNAQQSAEAGAPDFTKKFHTKFDEWAKTTAGTFATPEARAKFQVDVEEMRAKLGHKALAFEITSAAAKSRDDLRTIQSTLDNSVQNNPDEFQSAVTRIHGLIDAAPRLSPAEKDDLKRTAGQSFAASAINGRLNAATVAPTFDQQKAEVDGVKAMLASPEWQGRLSEKAYTQYVDETKRLEVHIVATERARQKQEVERALEAMRLGGTGVVLPRMDMQPPADQEAYRRTEKLYKSAAGFETQLSGMTPADRAAELARTSASVSSATTTEGAASASFIHNRKTEAAIRIEQRFAADPAAASAFYSPTVRGMVAEENQALARGDQKGAAEIASRRMEASLIHQNQIGGVPPEKQSVFTMEQVATIRSRVASVDLQRDGPEKVMDTLVGIRAEVDPKFWGLAIHQLIRDKAMDPSWEVLSEYATPEKRAAGASLAQALRGVKDNEKAVQETVRTELKKEVQALLLPEWQVTAQSQGGPARHAAKIEAAYALAVQTTAGGKSASEAAKDAVEVVRAGRTMMDDPSGNLILPAYLKGQDAHVRSGLDSLRAAITPATVRVDFTIDPRIPKDHRDTYVQSALRAAQWRPDPSGQGVTLVWGDRSAGAVRRTDGTAVAFTWAQIMSLSQVGLPAGSTPGLYVAP